MSPHADPISAREE
ncbi:hypothetical protein PENANT_c016G07984 [Penicillium antarcticum]|uniref:Uncharacterized protein n=1 Tax=Penicillium antarcticum TaxID=416450 RepID=A0A1V6Q2J6_9EURO|nr:hypothetical protein PENANT_c016G07984 [Penicillium antarcticum]